MIFFNEDSTYTIRLAMDIVENEISEIKKQIEDYFSPFHVPKDHRALLTETFEELDKNIMILVHYQAHRNMDSSKRDQAYVDNQVNVIKKEIKFKLILPC